MIEYRDKRIWANEEVPRRTSGLWNGNANHCVSGLGEHELRAIRSAMHLNSLWRLTHFDPSDQGFQHLVLPVGGAGAATAVSPARNLIQPGKVCDTFSANAFGQQTEVILHTDMRKGWIAYADEKYGLALRMLEPVQIQPSPRNNKGLLQLLALDCLYFRLRQRILHDVAVRLIEVRARPAV